MHRSALILFSRYVMAAGVAIVVQSLLTKWLSLHLHYIIANLVAIVLASVCSFIANDRLTFRRRRAKVPPPADVPEKP